MEREGGAEHVDRIIELIRRPGTQGNLVTDAQISAVAIEHGGGACSNDSDCRRFSGLRTTNPPSPTRP